MGQTLDCFGKGTEFTQSHLPEEVIGGVARKGTEVGEPPPQLF